MSQAGYQSESRDAAWQNTWFVRFARIPRLFAQESILATTRLPGVYWKAVHKKQPLARPSGAAFAGTQVENDLQAFYVAHGCAQPSRPSGHSQDVRGQYLRVRRRFMLC